METTEYRLGDVCKLRNGYAFKSENFTNEGIPVVRISNISDNQATIDKALKTSPSSVFEKFLIKKGDILIAMSGATTGKFGRYNSDTIAYQNQRVGCFVITNEEKIGSNYLYLLLNGLKKKIESDAYGGGQPNISSNIIENYKIHLPSLENQERITSIVNKAETILSLRKASVPLLDELMLFTFFKYFGDPVKNEKKWDIVNIDDVCNDIFLGLTNKVDYVENGGYPLIRTTDINGGKLSFDNVKYISEKQHKKITKNRISKRGDILVSKSGTLGTTAIVETDIEFTTYESIITIQTKPEVLNNHFLNFLLRNKNFQIKILGGKVGGTVGHLNLQMFRSITLPLPPIGLQLTFTNIILKTEILKEEYSRSLNELEELLNSLSQRAIIGEFKINETIEISSNITIQPKIPAEVIAIDEMNKELADFHNSISESGAPNEIDNKLKQLDVELKLRGEIPFWDEYVKYRFIKVKPTIPFTFEKLWKQITAFPFESVPDYDKVKEMIFGLLKSDNQFLIQRFNESDKQIELLLNETTSA